MEALLPSLVNYQKIPHCPTFIFQPYLLSPLVTFQSYRLSFETTIKTLPCRKLILFEQSFIRFQFFIGERSKK